MSGAGEHSPGAALTLAQRIALQRELDKADDERDAARAIFNPRLAKFREQVSSPVGEFGPVKPAAVRDGGTLTLADELRGLPVDRAEKRAAYLATLASRGDAVAFPLVENDGRVYRAGDADETPWCDVEEMPEYIRAKEANEVFNRVCERETGLVVDAARKAKKDREEALLLAQTHIIAKKLEAAGVPAYLATEWIIATYGVHSGELRALPKFRRKMILPFVASKLREPRVRDLEFWLQSDDFARFWTLTSGPRVRLRDLRKTIRKLHRRITRLNAEPFMIEAGVRIVFRATELGTVERKRTAGADRDGVFTVSHFDESGAEAGGIERDANGELWFHPHAHCLVHLEKGRMEYGQWCKFLETLRAYWGDWMDDAGVIKKAREAVKYVTKPGDIEHLSGEELAQLDAQLARLHMVQPLGALAAQIKAREENGLTLMPETTEDGRVWVEELDPNKRAAASKERVKVKYAESGAAGVELVGTFTQSQFEKENARQFVPADVDACNVVARVSPGAASNCVKEPRVVVMFKRWDAKRVDSHPLVERLRTFTRDAWLAGCALAEAAPISVHTGTATVPASPPSRPPRPASPEFRAHLARLESLAER